MSKTDLSESAITLSVIVPTFNQASSILENVAIIRERVAAELDEPFEVIVVSDGSVDETEERLLESRSDGVRVLHYDRNLGKGYAVKVGVLEARGEWIGYVDADLDLDPKELGVFVRAARRDRLDFAIGSKRHPGSRVEYPPLRRAESWLFQQLVRLLFRLRVSDTQVGLKVFRREIADEVFPFLLVKRYAFDIELLSVARAFGFDRVGEFPVRLDYGNSGSGVHFLAVVKALLDTAAVFYRLRILRTYQRKRAVVGRFGWTRPKVFMPAVSVIGGGELEGRIDYPSVEIVASPAQAKGIVLAFVEPGGVPASNWLAATVPFLGRENVRAVVTPTVAPRDGTLRQRAAAAVRESRLGGGSQYFRYTPGNIRFVGDFPGSSVVLRREDYLALGAGGIAQDRICEALADASLPILYTPESLVVAPVAPLWAPHLKAARAGGTARARAVRMHGAGWLRLSSLVLLLALVWVAFGWLLAFRSDGLAVWLAGLAVYVTPVLVASAIGGARFRSVRVGAMVLAAFFATHVAYGAGLLAGLARRRQVERLAARAGLDDGERE